MLIRTIFATMTVIAATSLAGCAHAPVPGAMTYCAIAKPISWSKHDTDQTIKEVKSANAVYKSLC